MGHPATVRGSVDTQGQKLPESCWPEQLDAYSPSSDRARSANRPPRRRPGHGNRPGSTGLGVAAHGGGFREGRVIDAADILIEKRVAHDLAQVGQHGTVQQDRAVRLGARAYPG